MKKTAMEQQIKQAFSHAVPDVLDSVLSHCEEQKGKVIMMPEQKKKNPSQPPTPESLGRATA